MSLISSTTLAITCTTLMDPASGTVNYDTTADGLGNYALGTVATYSCVSGNGLNGIASRICAGDGSISTGSFDGSAPTCEREWGLITIASYCVDCSALSQLSDHRTCPV